MRTVNSFNDLCISNSCGTRPMIWNTQDTNNKLFHPETWDLDELVERNLVAEVCSLTNPEDGEKCFVVFLVNDPDCEPVGIFLDEEAASKKAKELLEENIREGEALCKGRKIQ